MGEQQYGPAALKFPSFILIFLLIFSIQHSEFAQGEAAVPFLLLQPSPSLSAMGQTGTSLPTEDPFGFVWNPAQLGYTSQQNNISFIFYPSKIDWIPAFNAGLELKGIALNAGYNFKDLTGVPLSFGFGYSNTELDFGNFNSSFESKDYYDAYSIGVGMDYFVQFNLGFTIKSITSELAANFGGEEAIVGKGDRTVTDFGVLVNVPILKLINENLQLGTETIHIIKPYFDFSLGYSKSNIGDKIYYIDAAQADPLPRMDRIGYGISMGLDLISDNFQIKSFNLAFTAEADDILISRDSTGEWSYQSTLSDLKFWKSVVNIEGDEKIVSHAGLKIDLFETVSFITGHFSGRGFDERKTNGYELRAKGLFKLWAFWANDPITVFLRDHIDIRYYNTTFFADNDFETKMTGLAIYLQNLNELF